MEQKISLQDLMEWGLQKVKYPIPLSDGEVVVGDCIQGVSVVNLPGDNSCIWVPDRYSAVFFLKRGHHILNDPEILKRRNAYLEDPDLLKKYPFWVKQNAGN
jgi:hypothetical protein